MARKARRAAPAGADITAVLGASQTGKGVYIRHRLREGRAAPVTLVWSPLEHPHGRDRYTELLDAARCEGSIPAAVAAVRKGARAVVYVPGDDPPAARTRPVTDRERREHLGKQFALFCRIAAACRGARVVVEELSRVTLPHWAPPAWRNLSTAGAHADLELIASSQRPALVDKHFLGNCTEIRCYRLFFAEDARELGRALQVPYTEIMNLPTLNYFHRVINECRTERGVQAVR